ncbi:MAG: hypothetical protein WBA57_02465 [Elainellaceae cyanobacterium]
MKRAFIGTMSALAIAGVATISTVVPGMAAANAPTVSDAGSLDRGEDHFVEVDVEGFALDRIRVVCVTFHELSDVEVSGVSAVSSVDYGFEEFTVTFDEAVPVGDTVRITMLDSKVRGRLSGLTVPYRIFGYSEELGEIPLGTAVVVVPEVTGR